MGGRLNFDGGTRPPYNLSIDYNFISFLKLPWPGDSEETFLVFESSCHLSTTVYGNKLRTKTEMQNSQKHTDHSQKQSNNANLNAAFAEKWS